MFMDLAMPFMPGVNLMDPDQRAKFFGDDTPLHERMAIFFGRSASLMDGFGDAIDVAGLPSVWSDPNLSNSEKLEKTVAAMLPGAGQGTLKSAYGILKGLMQIRNNAQQ